MFFIIFLLFLSYNKACYSPQNNVSIPTTVELHLPGSPSRVGSDTDSNYNTFHPQTSDTTHAVDIPLINTTQTPRQNACLLCMFGCACIVIITGGITSVIHLSST